MAWNESIITVKGIDLAAELMNGGSMEITKAEIGESITDSVALAYQGVIQSPINVPVNIAKKEKTENGVILTVQIQNAGAEKAYKMRQLGIYAKTANSAETLFAVLQSADGEEIPSEAEYPNFLLEFTANIAVSNTDNISVVTNPATVIVTEEILEAAMEEHTSDKSNPHGVTKAQVGLGNVPNVSTNDQTPTYGTVTALAKLVMGEKLGIAFGKIAKAVDELIAHLADNVKHITAAERTAWNGKAAGDHTHSTATQSAAGFMSAADKKKLDGVAAGANAYTHPSGSGSRHIPSGGSSGQILRWSGDGTAVWGPDNNTTYTNMGGASASAAGKTGLVPAPAAGKQTSFLRGDGQWVIPPDTKYSHPTTAGNKHIPSGGSSGQILRWSADGTAVWGNDNNTTYTVATSDKSGLMSGADKTKLNNTLSITSITQGMIKSLSVTLGTYYIPNVSRATKALVEIWKTESETLTNSTPKVFTTYVSFYKAGMSNNMTAVNEVNLISAPNLTINYKIGSDGRIGINGTISDGIYYRATWYL